jgi:class 3 adenylate cyclase
MVAEDKPMGSMTSLPTGTVTFLFTDIEGSTRLWEQHPQAMQIALARHNALLTAAWGAGRAMPFDRVMGCALKTTREDP